jgi:hypothetical protein
VIEGVIARKLLGPPPTWLDAPKVAKTRPDIRRWIGACYNSNELFPEASVIGVTDLADGGLFLFVRQLADVLQPAQNGSNPSS